MRNDKNNIANLNVSIQLLYTQEEGREDFVQQREVSNSADKIIVTDSGECCLDFQLDV